MNKTAVLKIMNETTDMMVKDGLSAETAKKLKAVNKEIAPDQARISVINARVAQGCPEPLRTKLMEEKRQLAAKWGAAINTDWDDAQVGLL